MISFFFLLLFFLYIRCHFYQPFTLSNYSRLYVPVCSIISRVWKFLLLVLINSTVWKVDRIKTSFLSYYLSDSELSNVQHHLFLIYRHFVLSILSFSRNTTSDCVSITKNGAGIIIIDDRVKANAWACAHEISREELG